MTARDDAIEAGAKALDAKWGDVVWAMVVDEATTVVDAVEPIIRADERERLAQDVLDACRHWAGVDPNPCATCERIAARIARGGESDG